MTQMLLWMNFGKGSGRYVKLAEPESARIRFGKWVIQLASDERRSPMTLTKLAVFSLLLSGATLLVGVL